MSIEVDIHGSVSLESFLNNLNNIQLIDVRSEVEWNEGHFESATLIPLDQFSEKVDNLDPNKQTVFICAKGYRAAIAWKIYQETFSDAVLSGYIIASVDYESKPILHVLPEEWHQEIATRIDEL